MRIAVVGAGAIGGLLAARFAQAGHQVSVVIRGANLHAVREQGLRLETDTSEQIIAQVKASDRPEDLGHQDLVLLTMKAHQLWQMSPSLSPLINPKTSIVTMQNGLPWWYFYKLPTAYQNQILRSVDPGGRISKDLPVDQILGSVVYPAAELKAPGVVRLIEGNRFSIGEIDGTDTGRLRELCQVFIEAGFKAPMSKDIRSEIWVKLWGNATFNPISALTHATLSQICGNPVSRSLIGDLMQEAQAVGEAFGAHFKVSINRRIDGAAAVGEHKTSMLQDVEAGRPMEIDALIGSVVELADIASIPVPRLKTVYACVKLLQEQLTQQSGYLKMATFHL